LFSIWRGLDTLDDGADGQEFRRMCQDPLQPVFALDFREGNAFERLARKLSGPVGYDER
jgi:hypothetical protein